MTNESVWPISIWQRFAIGLDVERPGYVCGANYTLTAVIRLHGPLDAGLLDAAFAQLTARHEDVYKRQMPVCSKCILLYLNGV